MGIVKATLASFQEILKGRTPGSGATRLRIIKLGGDVTAERDTLTSLSGVRAYRTLTGVRFTRRTARKVGITAGELQLMAARLAEKVGLLTMIPAIYWAMSSMATLPLLTSIMAIGMYTYSRHAQGELEDLHGDPVAEFTLPWLLRSVITDAAAARPEETLQALRDLADGGNPTVAASRLTTSPKETTGGADTAPKHTAPPQHPQPRIELPEDVYLGDVDPANRLVNPNGGYQPAQ